MRLYDRIAAAMLWVAAFCFAAGVFFSLTLSLKLLPPTAPVAVGLVTILRYSKLQDYVGAALFFLLVPPLTVWFERIGRRLLAREQERFARIRRGRSMAVALLFTAPFVLSPLLYLTTGKVGWILLLPLGIAYAGPRSLLFYESHRWLRRLLGRDLYPYHALLFGEAFSWLLYRYLVTGRRIAHYPTLLLEGVFVALFLALFWAVAFHVARLAQIAFGVDEAEVFRRLTTSAVPLIVLPLVPIFQVPATRPAAVLTLVLLIVAALALRVRRPFSPHVAWGLAAYALIPFLVYIVSYTSTAHLTQWIDLFHRGESIGPASDYLRGKVPYRDVFVLHGMLDDGLFDAWLMKLFGRSLEVSVAREVVVGAVLSTALWYLAIFIFRSIPLSILTVAISAWITAENNRTVFQVAAVASLWLALWRRKPVAAIFSGVLAAIALFYSYEIGLYTIGGAVAVLVLVAIIARRNRWEGASPWRTLAAFAAGFVLGFLPFAIYLAINDALDDFLLTSFVTIPRLIDPVWSLPFPDLVSTFRSNLSLHTLSDFVLYEKFRLILSPLTIAIASVYLIQRAVRRRFERLDYALLALVVFALVAQRTAFGRAEFRHQYFASFLIGPILVLLAILAARRLHEAWREGEEGARAFIAAAGLAVLPLFLVIFWVPDLINARINDLINYQRRVLRVLPDPNAEGMRLRISEVSRTIRELTRPNDALFDFSNQPAFYFFADRPNATRFYQVPVASPPVFQAEIIADLERTKPKVIVRTSPDGFDEFDNVPNSMRAQAVAAYLDDAYRYFRTVRGVELWTRVRSAPVQPVSSYLRRIHLPAEKELATETRSRIVFPLVGSTPGGGGTFWVSDLTVHNPFKETMPLSLRYVSGDIRLDRRVNLSGRSTIRWPDVVKTLFRAPESRGLLWLEHRGARVPVARISTWDTAHDGRPSVVTPMSARDSATAQTDIDALTIVGLPGGGATRRRINVGVVNIGQISATFRLTVASGTGKPIGGHLEIGIPEDESHLLTDVESELGADIDESTTVHVTIVAGTCIAYATVVDASGDNQFIPAIPSPRR
jgi:hypothetical protein